MSRPFVKEAQCTSLLVKEAQVVWSQCYTRVESVVVFLIKEQSVEIKEALESAFILSSGDNSRVCGGSLWWMYVLEKARGCWMVQLGLAKE